ncbi:type I restriction enzyme S subunit [Anoxybacillus tengchongensis]|uniref:Type I restriction enzyme S subunit n=1 Tax=Anoxybacillus tengchongensis TaxID=576944 RepID=A0A7X0DAP1_9BACL|nr:restriction endonuclease subunit S [Anoxybacillus tengchongensis]MBB6177066.1 type I restriction enzyme S subunit [Anoxybacillus tengchongensis]
MKYVKLKEVFKVIKGKKVEQVDEADENTVRLIQIDDLRNDDNIKYCERKEEYIYAARSDVIIAWDGANAGTVGYGLEGAIGSTLAILRTNSNDIFTPYLGRFLQSKSKYLRDTCTGATIPHISKKILEEIKIPIPSYDKQVEISKILDKSQELIDKRKAQIEALDQLAQSLFLEMFGDPATNPKKWSMGFIKDLALKTQYGTSKKANESAGKYPILRMNNITYEGHWDFTDLKYVDLDDKEIGKYLVHKGELLFNRTNSKELVGKTAVYRFEKPMAFAGYLVKLIPNEKANAEFISAYLNSKYGKSILFSMAKNIVGMANINAEELKSIKIYIPPKQLQDRFAETVQKIESQRELFKKGLVELEKNFNSLMQRAFKGELFND